IISDNAANSPHSVALSGMGTPTAASPAAPTPLVIEVTPQGPIAVHWTDRSDNETAFALWRKRGSAARPRIAVVVPNTTRYTDTAVAPGVAYAYRVRATNNSGASVWTNEVGGTALPRVPRAPTGLTVTAGGDGQLDLAWTDGSDNETAFALW